MINTKTQPEEVPEEVELAVQEEVPEVEVEVQEVEEVPEVQEEEVEVEAAEPLVTVEEGKMRFEVWEREGLKGSNEMKITK